MVGMDVRNTGYEPSDDRLPQGWRFWAPRTLGVAAFLAMAIVWIYVFANRGTIPHPDEFDDPVFSSAAEAVCADYQGTIAALPLATSIRSAVERAPLIAAGTVELEAMVADLAELTPPANAKGEAGVARWLEDYELYLDDRRRYADVLSSGEDPPFLVSATEDNVRVTDLLGTFAEVNNMASCGPSGDL